MIKYANPRRFMQITDTIVPWGTAASAAAFAIGLYLVFFVAPPDYQQGNAIRIMYVHVPSAWLALFCYTLMALSSIGSIVWRHPLADVAAKSAAPIGATFTFIALATGALWGKPMWGVWWEWRDTRLTSVFVLFLMYLGLIALWRAFDDHARAARAAAVLTLVGFINIPFIKFSVEWWSNSTLHQRAGVMRLDGPAIHPSMLWPLLVMALAFTCLFVTLHIVSMRAELLRRRVARRRLVDAQDV